jgi:hypothetical protein
MAYVDRTPERRCDLKRQPPLVTTLDALEVHAQHIITLLVVLA